MQILLVGHADFPEGLLSAARMIVGDKADAVTAVGLRDAVEFKKRITAVLRASAETVVLADLLGGSPCNTVVEVAGELNKAEGLTVVTGVNLGLLLELTLARRPPSLETLLARAAPRVLDLTPSTSNDDEL